MRATSSATTPFCGPKIAVAPSAPVSGLLTSDMMRISQPAIRGSSPTVVMRASEARPSGVAAIASPLSLDERDAEGRQESAAAVVGAAAAEAHHEAAHAGVEQALHELAQAARRARPDGGAHRDRIGDADDLRDLDHRGQSVAMRDEPVGGVDRVAGRACDARLLAPPLRCRPRRARHRACLRRRPPSAGRESRPAGIARVKPARERRAHLRRGQRSLERIGGEDDAGHSKRHPSRGHRRRRASRASGGRARRAMRRHREPPRSGSRPAPAASSVAQVRVEVVRVARRHASGASIQRAVEPVRRRARVRASTASARRVAIRDLAAQARAATRTRRRARRVVRRRACPMRAAPRRSAARGIAAEHARQRFGVDAAGPQQHRLARRRTRRSCSRCRRRTAPPSRISRDVVAEVVGDVLRGRRRHVTEAVRRRRGDPGAAGAANAASSACATGCEGTRRPMRVLAAGDGVGRRASARGRISVSGPGQNASASARAPRGIVARPLRRRRAHVGHVHDHRMIGRPSLRRRRCARTASRIAGVGAQPVDGLGRKRDQLALAQALRRRARCVRRRRDDAAAAASIIAIRRLREWLGDRGVC